MGCGHKAGIGACTKDVAAVGHPGRLLGSGVRDFVGLVLLRRGVCMFKRGKSGNPRGRPKGSVGGRAMAVIWLDGLLVKKENKELVCAAFQEALKRDTLGFFKSVVMPLMPKDAKLTVARDGIVEWKSLLGDEPGEKPRFDAEGRPIPGR